MRRIFAVALLLAPLPALAQEEKDTPAPRPTGDDMVVCKRIVEVGTRLGHKECRTRREWKELAEAQRQNFDSLRRAPVRD